MYKNYYKVVKLNPNIDWPTEKELVNLCDQRPKAYGYIKKRVEDGVLIDVYLKETMNPFESTNPTLVKVFSEGCGPCRQLSPILNEVKASLGDKVSLIEFDGPENRDLLKKYGISKVPTLVYVKDGQIAHTHQGIAGLNVNKIKNDILIHLGVQ